jgi:hypothetical protein
MSRPKRLPFDPAVLLLATGLCGVGLLCIFSATHSSPSPAFKGIFFSSSGGVSADYENFHLRIDFQKLLETLPAAHLRHDEVQKHETNVVLVFLIDLQCLSAIRCG